MIIEHEGGIENLERAQFEREWAHRNDFARGVFFASCFGIVFWLAVLFWLVVTLP